MTLAPESVETLRTLVGAGASVAAAAREAGVCLTTAQRYAERGFQPISRKGGKPDARSYRMAALYRAGQTLEQIGKQYGVTRERVRQILTSKHGMNRASSGAHVAGEENKSKLAVERDARYLRKYGCTWAQYHELRAFGRTMMRAGAKHPRTPIGAFNAQRKNARAREIGWELTLWQWWSIWQASGHWEQRGRGQGYCMCRRGDAGPYALENVFIALSRENSSEQDRKKSGLPMGVLKNVRSAGYRAHRQIKGKHLRLGTFATPEEAHAAYLAAGEAA